MFLHNLSPLTHFRFNYHPEPCQSEMQTTFLFFSFFFLNGSTFWPLPADVEVNSWNTATCAFKSSTPRIEQQLWGDIRTSSYYRMWIIAYQQISSKWNHSKWWKYQNEWITLCTRNEMIWKNKTSLDCQDSRDILYLTKNTCIQGVILRFMWPVLLRFEALLCIQCLQKSLSWWQLEFVGWGREAGLK